ncbi:MAG: hypothetical protein QNK35_01835, partial [Bacteroides sp.]|nr:hypothetical protein [Bacteroides sp.]
LIFFLIPGIFSFFSAQEDQIFSQQLAGADPQYASQFRQFMTELETARISIFRHDAIRSFVLISLAFGLTWYFANKKIKTAWFLAGLAILVTVDLWMVDRRYLNSDNFITKQQQDNTVAATQADNLILQDPDIHYRVVNLTKSPWSDGTTSFHHKSIGGYHGVKLRRYQDLIERYLSPELQNIVTVLNARPTPQAVDSVLAAQQVLNMINTKYMILNPASQPLLNRAAMGHGWLVKDIKIVENADEEFLSLASTNLNNVAIVDKRFSSMISDDMKNPNPTGSVELTNYKPNHMTYQVIASQKSLVVFSDIYYGDSWHASIDGVPVSHLRANYILRALPVDAGTHIVEFEFIFEAFEKGEKISLAGSFLVLLLLLGGLAYSVYLRTAKKTKEEA